MDTVEKHDTHLIQAIKDARKPESQQPISLSEDLKQIGVDVTHVAGSTFNELMSGEGRDARDRVARQGNPIRIVRERELDRWRKHHKWK